uniref:Uncharacterized protein n=1 Tax=Oryza rufipogon TaxID=4529 RepID=A0A0E0PZ05_ORYRU
MRMEDRCLPTTRGCRCSPTTRCCRAQSLTLRRRRRRRPPDNEDGHGGPLLADDTRLPLLADFALLQGAVMDAAAAPASAEWSAVSGFTWYLH